MKDFFTQEHNAKMLRGFINKYKAITVDVNEIDELHQSRKDNLIRVLACIDFNRYFFEQKCEFSIVNIGPKLIKSLENGINKLTNDEIDNIYCYCFQFLCEADFTNDDINSINENMQSVKNYMFTDIMENKGPAFEKMMFSLFALPSILLKKQLNEKNISSMFDLYDRLDKVSELNSKWSHELKIKEEQVERLEKKLDAIKHGHNFVELHDGFLSLLQAKSKELSYALKVMVSLAVCMISPLIYELLSLYNANDVTIGHFMKLVPIIPIEIILAYFFKIALSNYRSVKAQIVQLELRQALCKFIKGYADYSHEIKSKNETSLEKFESMIFSGIVTNIDSVPSTFDGLEQIGSFIKSIRS